MQTTSSSCRVQILRLVAKSQARLGYFPPPKGKNIEHLLQKEIHSMVEDRRMIKM